MSPLDHALVAAMSDESKQSIFYNSFLSAELFIPVHDGHETEVSKRAAPEDSISPIFVESDGIQYLVLFDSEERLSQWAEKDVGFVALPGHAIVEMMSTDFHWALNVGTDYPKTFVPDEIAWLKQSLANSKGQATRMPAGTKVAIGAPATIPAGLMGSLLKTLSRTSEVKRAYLGQVHYEADGEKPHLALVLELDEVQSTTADAIRKDLAIAAKGFLGKDEYLDILLGDESSISQEIVKALKPFYGSSQE